MALARESDNSEDVSLKKQINQSENKLKMVIAPFVESSKSMAINISDQSYYSRWKSSSTNLLQMVQEVAKLFSDLQLHSPPAPANTKVPVIIEPPPPQIPSLPSQVCFYLSSKPFFTMMSSTSGCSIWRPSSPSTSSATSGMATSTTSSTTRHR